MKKLIYFLLLVVSVASCSANKEDNYTIIISLDGFRYDYREMYDTPNLDRIAAGGVEAIMQPSFPASTFPNHYTLATGLVPDNHGIVDNSFWDKELDVKYSMSDYDTRQNPSFYGGEPIWITAVRQGVKCGTIYWVGSDLHIQATDPTYYFDYQKKPLLTYEERADTLLSWLNKPESTRPKFIMNYYDEPDGTGHGYGPRSEETGACVSHLDSLMGALYDSLMALPIAKNINLIITSDHGMATLSNERVINPNDYLKDEWIKVSMGATPTNIFANEGCVDSIYNALKGVENLNVWKREEIPAEVAYGSNVNRVGDIVVSPKAGWQFTANARDVKGAHGYLPSEEQMKVMFVAQGPDFKQGYKAAEFKNVDIYTMLCRLLNLTPAKTDGVPERIEAMFR